MMRSLNWWLFVVTVVCGACSADKQGDQVSRNSSTGFVPGQGLAGSTSTPVQQQIPGQNSFGNPNPNATPAATMKIPEMACGMVDIQAARVTPTVMLLVDGSTSMEMQYPDMPMGTTGGTAGMTGGTAGAAAGAAGTGSAPPAVSTRWQAVRQALVDPTNGVVPKLGSIVKFGLAVFGTQATCPLPLGVVAPAINNVQAITSGMPQTEPGMFTPTGIALDQIVDMLPDPTGVADKNPGPQIVVLATDGDPNACEIDPGAIFTGMLTDYGPSIAAAMKLKAKHQKMYVIAVGNDAGKQHLQEMANIGAGMDQKASPGAPVYYPENPAALADTLAALIGKELSCDVELQGRGVRMGNECKGTVELNGVALECNGADGWALKDPTHIELKGKTCDSYKNASDAMLHAKFPCDSLVM